MVGNYKFMESNMKVGVFIIGGDYPLGSSALRKRMMHYGLKMHGIKTELLHFFPAMSIEDIKKSEDFVHFFLKPKQKKITTENKIQRSLFSIILRLKGIFRVIRWMKHYEISFVLITGGFLEGMLLSRYCKKNKVKFFVERCDENRRKFLKIKSVKDYFAIIYEELFDKYIIKKCDRLFVVSKYLEDKYRNMHSKLSIIRATPSFVDLPAFDSCSNRKLLDFLTQEQKRIIENDKLNIVFCGSYIFHNGINFFLESASELKEKHTFQIIFIIFKGHIKLLYQKIDKLALNKHFLLIENVMSDNIPAIYKKSDILVLPEMGIEVANAGFPGKVAEYLASGKAIISTDFSNLTDYLQHDYNAMMSDSGDKETYISNLNYLLEDSSLRERIGKTARNTAETHFSLKKGIQYLVDSIYMK
ncbi:MAG: hypothetical protein SRB1_02015 [Desulfobacteraceae bacterium Eth-SRB1]|nr:MAG: hypothetical protein SRB1_02015 [Desulfobacteraceae bacterium Eth-SRB1]